MLSNLNEQKCYAIRWLVIVFRTWGQATDQMKCRAHCKMLTSAACIILSVFGMCKAKQYLCRNTSASSAQEAEHLAMKQSQAIIIKSAYSAQHNLQPYGVLLQLGCYPCEGTCIVCISIYKYMYKDIHV